MACRAGWPGTRLGRVPPRISWVWPTLLGALLVALAGCSAPEPILPTPTPLPPLESPVALAPVLSPVTTPRPPASPTPLPLVVYGTDGQGLALRRTPGLDGERLNVWPEGTVMIPLGEERQVDGLSWKRVRDPEGQEGWAAAAYLVDQATAASLPTPTPVPTRAIPPTPAGPTPTLPPLRPTFTPAPEAAPTRGAPTPRPAVTSTPANRPPPTPTPRR